MKIDFQEGLEETFTVYLLYLLYSDNQTTSMLEQNIRYYESKTTKLTIKKII